jgi:predicted DCC family thiol-disulfide oxidoreductase YuxK
MPDIPAYPLKIFFDGSCSVCAAEMAIYQRKEHGGRLQFVDISAPDFDPAPYGISLEALMYEMHAIDRENRVYRGVEAFRAIWQAFPSSTRYGLLGALVNLPGINLLARSAYWCFARSRKFLPKSRTACRDGTCGLGRNRPPGEESS